MNNIFFPFIAVLLTFIIVIEDTYNQYYLITIRLDYILHYLVI